MKNGGSISTFKSKRMKKLELKKGLKNESLEKLQKDEMMKARGGRETTASTSGTGTCGEICSMTCYSNCEFLSFNGHSNAMFASSNNAACLACNTTRTN